MRTLASRAHGFLQNVSSPFGICWTCRRTFTCSAAVRQRIDQYPLFQEGSSLELESHLLNARQKALLPYFVNRDQRRLIIRPENKARLEYDPLYIQVGSVEERLEYINIKSDIPSAYKVFKKAIELAKTARDWENIARLLRGFMNTKHGLKDHTKEWIIRKMIEADCQYIVMQLLLEVNKTGISLKQEGLRNRILFGIFQLAADNDWDEASTKKALSFSEQVIDMLEKDEHGGGSRVTVKEDARCSPFVVALPLEMAAVRAKRHLGGVDEGGKVARYAGRLMGMLEQHGIPEEKPGDSDFATKPGARNLWELWIPVWHSLKEAQGVLGEAMPKKELANRAIAKLEAQIGATYKSLQKRKDLTIEPAGVKYWNACRQ